MDKVSKNSEKFKPKTFYDELADYGYLDDFLHAYLPEKINGIEKIDEEKNPNDHIRKLESEKKMILDSLKYFRTEASNLLKEIDSNIEDRLKLLESRSADIFNIYYELDQISLLAGNLKDLYENSDKQYKELKNQLNVSKNANEVLESLLGEYKKKLSKELENADKKLDIKIALKFRKVEDKLSEQNNKFWSLNDTQGRQFKLVTGDVEEIRHEIYSIKGDITELNKKSDSRFSLLSEAIYGRIKQIDDILMEFNNLKTDVNDRNYLQKEVFDRENKSVKDKIKNLQVDAGRYKISNRTALVTSIISLILVVFMGVLLLIL